MRKEDFKRLGLHTRAQRQQWLRRKRALDNCPWMKEIRKGILIARILAAK